MSAGVQFGQCGGMPVDIASDKSFENVSPPTYVVGPGEETAEFSRGGGAHAAANKSKRDRVEAFISQGLSTLASSAGRRQAAFMEKKEVPVEYGLPVLSGGYCYVKALVPELSEVLSRVMGPSPMVSQLLALPSAAFKSDKELHGLYLQEVSKNVYHMVTDGVLSFRDHAAACVQTYPAAWFGEGIVERFGGIGFPKSFSISYPRWRARVGSGDPDSGVTAYFAESSGASVGSSIASLNEKIDRGRSKLAGFHYPSLPGYPARLAFQPLAGVPEGHERELVGEPVVVGLGSSFASPSIGVADGVQALALLAAAGFLCFKYRSKVLQINFLQLVVMLLAAYLLAGACTWAVGFLTRVTAGVVQLGWVAAPGLTSGLIALVGGVGGAFARCFVAAWCVVLMVLARVVRFALSSALSFVIVALVLGFGLAKSFLALGRG